MQVCRSGLSSNRRIWLTRHGESEYNRLGLVGGDAPLTDKGRQYATQLARALCALVPMPDEKDELLPISCWTSTLQRTIQTARHIPFPKLRWKALDEIHAGVNLCALAESTTSACAAQALSCTQYTLVCAPVSIHKLTRACCLQVFVMAFRMKASKRSGQKRTQRAKRTRSISGTQPASLTWMSSSAWSPSSLKWSARMSLSALWGTKPFCAPCMHTSCMCPAMRYVASC